MHAKSFERCRFLYFYRFLLPSALPGIYFASKQAGISLPISVGPSVEISSQAFRSCGRICLWFIHALKWLKRFENTLLSMPSIPSSQEYNAPANQAAHYNTAFSRFLGSGNMYLSRSIIQLSGHNLQELKQHMPFKDPCSNPHSAKCE